ncbi:MAG: VTC domain-containing protein [bacterium]|nr:VTC domain-containing protein [bacterium]
MANRASSPTEPTYRFERKFYVEDLDTREIEMLVRLHPAFFSPLHPPRYVNSVYFDTPDHRALVDNVDGTADRCKMRIRWYGGLTGESRATLEFKIKRGLVGRKETVDLGSIRVDRDRGLAREELAVLLRSVVVPPAFRELVNTTAPTLANRYRRRYYQTADGRYRLTLDDELHYFPFVAGRATLLHPSRDRRGSVVELKYGPEHDADRITGAFPFRLTKNSKYVSGLQRLQW